MFLHFINHPCFWNWDCTCSLQLMLMGYTTLPTSVCCSFPLVKLVPRLLSPQKLNLNLKMECAQTNALLISVKKVFKQQFYRNPLRGRAYFCLNICTYPDFSFLSETEN